MTNQKRIKPTKVFKALATAAEQSPSVWRVVNAAAKSAAVADLALIKSTEKLQQPGISAMEGDIEAINYHKCEIIGAADDLGLTYDEARHFWRYWLQDHVEDKPIWLDSVDLY